MEQRPLRVGLIVDSPNVSHYIADLVSASLDDPLVDISCLIIQNIPRPSASWPTRLSRLYRRLGPSKFLGLVTFMIMTRFEQVLLRSDQIVRRHLRNVSIEGLVTKSIHVTPEVSPSKLVFRYSPQDLARIREAGLDVLVRCGSGILRGEILTIVPMGIVSFHHGDNRVHRGGPPGFWETFRREPSTGFIIQRLTEELDGGKVLLRGNFITQKFYLRNQAYLFAKSNPFMLRTLDQLSAQGDLPEEPSIPFDGQIDITPGTFVTLHYWSVMLGWIIMAMLRKARILNIREEFHVAYSRGSWQTTVLSKALSLPNPPGRFLADPFVITRDGRTCCFVEDFDFEEDRGCISVYEFQEEGPTFLGKVLDEPFHLSFPFLFDFNGNLYMCPETIDAGSVRVYECVSFPLIWRLCETIVEGLRAADPVIFPDGGRWWMLATLDYSETGDFDSALALFWAETPLSTNWARHPATPLMIDSAGGRNGGLLREGASWIRVAQCQAFDSYGKSASLMRVETLTTDRYSERELLKILPKFAPRVEGLHHFHSNGEWTVFDYKMQRYQWFGRD